ncbi:hypothetical protein [Polyangium jinanense]|uniref:Uncharacterized protein n=1 Tax=Polyangium jinanense TaxID=2829994 RepID=A0A9X3XCW3_9BACT|nr:hypothetical protein [Polyangium jinanense]MDC3961762.1 hypothetical protein [Polyangium jinanense]MDC3988344.1 hypothetical protein [Polyangium jinanense]
MSEPTRLRDDGPDDVRALLRAGSKARPMTKAERARTSARLGRYAAAAVVAGGISWLPAAALCAGLGAGTALVAWGVHALIAPAPPPSAPPPSPPAALTVAQPPPPAAPPAPSPSSTATPPPPAPRAPISAAPAPSLSASAEAPAPDPLAEEAALLERARAALNTSPAEALSLAEAHAARFPTGKLGMEREIVIIDALRRLGRTDEARTRGEALLSRARGSLYEERVRKRLEGAR